MADLSYNIVHEYKCVNCFLCLSIFPVANKGIGKQYTYILLHSRSAYD